MTAARNVPDILSQEFAENPYPTYRALRESEPLVWHEATQSYLISRYEDVARAFKDKESLFTTDNYAWQAEPVHGKTILQMSGREHSTRRALVAPAFRGNELREKVVPVIERNARELIDAFRDVGSVDLVSGFASHFQDRGLIDRAFAETLRYSPPVHMIMRQAAADVPVSGGTIPAGATVTCLIGAANRDPGRYEDPDRFDIFRTDLTATTAFSAAADHLAFALGRHFCVGALLARAEVEIATNQLLDAMPDIRPTEGYDPAEQGVFTRGPRSLLVEFTPAGR
ncbi:cytochrome P450 [Streptomyces sp. NPDC060010]|uniref:cytochrome P450 n=1 Tax=Streptomyces sp. NPDC060010 TaxID=3347036 RepID=UPI0036A0493A